MRSLILMAALLAASANADYSIKTSNGTDVLLKSTVINGVHIPAMTVVETASPLLPLEITVEPDYITETITSATGLGPVVIEPAYTDPTLFKITDVEGMTSLNGYWHSPSADTIETIANGAYTSGGEYQAIQIEEVTRDLITTDVFLQLTDTGTASLYGASNTAGMKVYAYNPMWPGERITLIDYQNPNSIYEQGGSINSITLNSVLYQTYSVPVKKFIPQGWFIAFEQAADFGLTTHVVKVKGTAGTTPLVLDGQDLSNTLLTPIIYTGTNLLTNGDFADWTDDEPDDWTVSNAIAHEQEGYASFQANGFASLSQDVTLTEGSTYVLQITCRGSSMYLSNIIQTGATSRSIDFQTESHRFLATTTNYTITVFFPRAYNFYDIESIELIEVN